MKTYKKIVAILMCMATLISCQQGEAVGVDDLDLVITNYNKEFDFKAIQTYALPDSVVLVNSIEYDGTRKYAKPAYGNLILDAIKRNMKEKGWELVSKTQYPDVILLPTISQSSDLHYFYSSAYWSWFFPSNYYPNGWGFYYPGYNFPVLASPHKTGSVLIQMTDPSDYTLSDQLPVAWVCIINGLTEGGNLGVQTRIDNGINQAFIQSPYLITK